MCQDRWVVLISVQANLSVLGLKSLHYELLARGYRSRLLHLPYLDFGSATLSALFDWLDRQQPLFVGVSLMTNEYYVARTLSEHLRARFADVPLVWGGIHPTISPESCFPYADYACVGEGEKTAVSLAHALYSGEDPRSIPNLCYFENGKMVRNDLSPLIDDLDEMPILDHIPEEAFIQCDSGEIVRLDQDVYRRHGRYQGRHYEIMTTRGCAFSCTYCCNNFLARLYGSKRIRRRSLEHILCELERAVRDNPFVGWINFQDDAFLAMEETRVRLFAAEYKVRVGKPFIIRTMPTYVTEERLRCLQDAGLRWVSMGLQSGSDRVCREVYHRKTSRESFLRAARLLRQMGIATWYDVIVDNPLETDEDRLETVQTLLEVPRPFFLHTFSLTLYPGTQLYDRVKAECPDQLVDARQKDFFFVSDHPLNDFTRMAAVLPPRMGKRLLALWKTGPQTHGFRASMGFCKLLTALVLEPVSYFGTIMLSTNGAFTEALRLLPMYVREVLWRHLVRFRTIKQNWRIDGKAAKPKMVLRKEDRASKRFFGPGQKASHEHEPIRQRRATR